MIDPSTEQLITVKEAARRPEFRINGKPCNVCTVWRKVLDGKLESLKIGGKRVTSVEAIRRYISRTNGQILPAVTPAAHERHLDAVGRELAAAGY